MIESFRIICYNSLTHNRLGIIMELDFTHLVTLYFYSFNSLIILVFSNVYSLLIVITLLVALLFGIMYFTSEFITNKRK